MTVPASALSVRDLTVAYDAEPVIAGLSLELFAGKLTAIIGPNGCGKSSLLRALARVLTPRHGAVLLAGDDIRHLPTRTVAQRMSYLPQGPAAPPGLTVAELVAHGRFPHRRRFAGLSVDDRAAIGNALDVTGLHEFANRAIDTLCGGQRQRAWIAMALAQGARTLLLDEPTNHLDPAHRLEVLDLLQAVVGEGRSVVVVLHDLHLAAHYADHLVTLLDGRLIAQGGPKSVLTPQVLREVFAIEADVIDDPVTGTPLVLPRRVAR